jgi:hypothetical protein
MEPDYTDHYEEHPLRQQRDNHERARRDWEESHSPEGARDQRQTDYGPPPQRYSDPAPRQHYSGDYDPPPQDDYRPRERRESSRPRRPPSQNQRSGDYGYGQSGYMQDEYRSAPPDYYSSSPPRRNREEDDYQPRHAPHRPEHPRAEINRDAPRRSLPRGSGPTRPSIRSGSYEQQYGRSWEEDRWGGGAQNPDRGFQGWQQNPGMEQGLGPDYHHPPGASSEPRQNRSFEQDQRRNEQRWRSQDPTFQPQAYPEPPADYRQEQHWRRREYDNPQRHAPDQNRGHANHWEASTDARHQPRDPSRYEPDQFDRQFLQRNDWEHQTKRKYRD